MVKVECILRNLPPRFAGAAVLISTRRLMSRLLRFVTTAILILSVDSSWAAPTQVQNVSMGDHVSIALEIYFPKTDIGGIVLMVPGTDGLGDSWLGQTIRQPVPDYDGHGGLTELINGQGYAVAYYYNRGISPPRHCISGSTFEERRHSFVERCIDQDLRMSLTLGQVTDDLKRVLLHTSNLARQKHIPLLVFAASEGMFHLSKIVELKSAHIQIDAIVGLSAPMTSLCDIFYYQLYRERIFEALREAFDNCAGSHLAPDEISGCLRTGRSLAVREEIDQMFGSTRIGVDRDEISKLQKEWMEYQRNNIKAILEADPSIYSASSAFQGETIRRAYSVKYLQESLTDCDSIALRLSEFAGPIYLIYGQNDAMLTSEAMRSPGYDNVKSVIIPGLDHSLKDPHADGFSNEVKSVFERILKTNKLRR